ncbi:MAG: hypothetical protein MSG64_08160 [Pyrinomonadaceae bacterium MAG19_C2-C3]|nr:hypothetical protein [Pyrinomonadaceae bacterium MAG19_C2-C3]
MNRKLLIIVLSLVCLVVGGAAVASVFSRRAQARQDDATQKPLALRVVEIQSNDRIPEALAAKLRSRFTLSAARKTGAARPRLLAFENIEEDDKQTNIAQASDEAPRLFKATYYDYERNRAFTLEGDARRPDDAKLTELDYQPLPNDEEFQDAVSVIARTPEFAAGFTSNQLTPYAPMPPVLEYKAGETPVERTLFVGLRSSDGATNEIVGVNMIRESIVRFAGGAPPEAIANAESCGLPDDPSQRASGRGAINSGANTTGQYRLTVSQNETPLWDMIVVRPTNSSGGRASGVELRDVRYRGKSVLKRAHVPILNVQYENNVCGPYRDWQWDEGTFEANGTDVANGFRVTTAMPRTILDTGNDTGNFQGVAAYMDGTDVVLISELEASWYRYVSLWRFHADGTIEPRFGFGSVANSCVCTAHNHHVYWRFDFDIDTPENNIVRQSLKRRPSLNRFGRTAFDSAIVSSERKMLRTPFDTRQWYVSNTVTNRSYMIRPGAADGIADEYGRGDMWFLRYKANSEIDDGRVSTTSPTEIGLDSYVGGESIINQDLVVWYGAHFIHTQDTHGDAAKSPVNAAHEGENRLIGPDLIPVNW